MATWQQRVKELRASGLTLREIGEATGMSTSAVSDLDTGYRVFRMGDAALALYKLHQQRCAGAGVKRKVKRVMRQKRTGAAA